MPTYDSIGDLFCRRRLDAGLSQQELASRAQVGVSTVSRLETDQSVPRAGNLAKLAMVLGIAPEQLEAFGRDAAADLLRNSLSDSQQSMRQAFAALSDVVVPLTKLGFLVELSQPDDGVLLLRCVQETPDTEPATAKPALATGTRQGEDDPAG